MSVHAVSAVSAASVPCLASLGIGLAACACDTVLPLGVGPLLGMAAHTAKVRPLPELPVGTVLRTPEGVALFRVVGRVLMAGAEGAHAMLCPQLQALVDIEPEALGAEVTVVAHREGYALAWVTLSDKGAAGQRVDESGPAIGTMVREKMHLCLERGFMIPDDGPTLRALLMELALGHGYDLILTTGGTGLGPRDVTPEVTASIIDKRLPGFEQCMMAASLAKTPNAIISRAVAGTLGGAIIVNLPGSRKAVVENLAAVLPALGHALDKLHGDAADCGVAPRVQE